MLGFKGFTSVILCSLALIMFGIFYPDIRPQTYDIKLFSIANNTIRSPKTVIDEEKTNEEKQKAAREVAKAYTYETSQVQNRVSLMNSIFDVVEEVNGKYEKQKESGKSSNKLQEEKLAKLKEILTENVSGNVAGSIFDNSFLALLSASPDDLDAVRSVVVSSAEEALGKKITEDDVAYARDAVAVKISRSALPAGKLRRPNSESTPLCPIMCMMQS